MKQQKQHIITIIAVVVIIVAAVSILPSLLTMVLSFLLAGSLPGMPFTVGPGVMFVGTVLLLAYFIGHIALTLIAKQHPVKRPSARNFTSKLPSRRFHRI